MVDMTRGRIGQGRPARGGDMRVGAIIAVPSLLAERGLDPVRVFAAVGLDPCLLDDPENRISFQDLGRLLAACADATGCPHFGLMAVERYGPDSLGAVGHQMRNSPTVGEALRNVQLHLHLNDRGAALFLLRLDPERVALCYTIFWHDTDVTSLIYDAALAVAHKALCELCGPGWKPLTVQFAHRRPAAALPYKRFFGTRPEFDAERCAIVFASSWLDHPVAGTDPALRDSLESAVHQLEASEPDSLCSESRDSLLQKAKQGDVIVIDVRPPAEYEAGHLPFARSMPLGELEKRLADLPVDCAIVAYCRGPFCLMSDEAVRMLRARGFAAQKISDGVSEWAACGLPIETSKN